MVTHRNQRKIVPPIELPTINALDKIKRLVLASEYYRRAYKEVFLLLITENVLLRQLLLLRELPPTIRTMGFRNIKIKNITYRL